MWGPDGTELFFQGGTLGGVGDFMTVSVTPVGETLSLGTPLPLFAGRTRGENGTYYS